MSRPRTIVTGAGSGIGRACAVALAGAGCDVVLAGRRQEALEETGALIADATPEATTLARATDVGRPEECAALVAEAVKQLDGLDSVVAAAAHYAPEHVLEITPQSWDETMAVVLRGSVLVAVAAARHMREHGGGRIVLVSSVNAYESEPETAAYSAAKAGAVSFAKSAALDLAGDGIIVNTVAPGFVDTPMSADFVETATTEQMRVVNPLARFGRPEEIASVATYLATQAPAFLTGHTVVVDGAQTTSAPIPQ